MELPQNCANCAHYDGDGFCALPFGVALIHGFIAEPGSVVCVKWTKPEPEDAPDVPEAR